MRQLKDGSGTVTLAQSYTPYGEILGRMGEGETRYTFTGEQYDLYSGLIYLRARYYAPQSGRFLTRDTWQGDYGRPLSYNAWLYGYANPIIYIDPSGHLPLLKFERDNITRTVNGVKRTAGKWTVAEMNAAEQAARLAANAFANIINENKILRKAMVGVDPNDCRETPFKVVTPIQAFLLIYKGPISFTQVPELGPEGAFAKVFGRNKVKIFTNHTDGYAIKHPGWVIHELGHAFEHALSPENVAASPGRTGVPLDFLVRKLPEENDDFAGFASGFENGYQYSRKLEKGEIFADMFLGWVYQEWAKEPGTGLLTEMGKRRSDHMNENLVNLIRSALNK